MSPGLVLNYADGVVRKIIGSECSSLVFSVSKCIFIILENHDE